MRETEFILIRHGESSWNAAGRWQGHGDPPLSARGREQAERVARELSGRGVEVIVSSDLTRAVETAAILGRAVGVAPERDPRLRELDVGRWTGSTREEIEARDADELARFESGAPDARAGGGECRLEIAARVRASVAELAEHRAGRRIAVVAHLGVVRALLSGTELANAEWRLANAREIAAALESPAGGRAGGSY